ncbi:M48 family metallopeptidase [Oscillibacter hominis]|uniref:M48 family metallopeptidase n=1 Tax=Oscillibacter hominis TaxID=2763056 RepID=A0A7G9B2B7_9FIRM|nr:SprT family zinc-dependent metalloprotease [Oscillibacter hominis]QNL43698.1 M48 family metallopeptidase [Oscillibacter hominis]
MQQITVDGETVLIHRKPIRNMYLRLSSADGPLYVTAPRSVSDQTVASFIRARRGWIEAQRSARPPRPPCTCSSGERFFLWGEPLPLRVEEGPSPGVSLSQRREIRMVVPPGSTVSQRLALLDHWYRQELQSALPGAIARGRAATGLQAQQWNIRDMRTRWGSCTPKTGAIRINLQLVRRPVACLDYVVVHELTHLLIPGHGPQFRQAMDRFYPSWKEVRLLLNQFDAQPLPPEVV